MLQGHRKIEQAIQKVDMDQDIQVLVQENSITPDDVKAEFLMTDYFVSTISGVGFRMMDEVAHSSVTRFNIRRKDDKLAIGHVTKLA